MAETAISASTEILPNVRLHITQNAGDCSLDTVMRQFVNFFDHHRMVGVLGPPCSEAIESIAGT